jgi:uncharacterized membrane protein YqhA
MSNITYYPYPVYESNKAAAAVLASLIGISSIAWIIQLIQSRFKPPRINVLLLICHLTIFVELVLRAALSTDVRNSKAALTATRVLFVVGQRMIIIANYDFITRVGDLKSCTSRVINIGAILCAVGSAIMLTTAGTLSYNTDTIDTNFRLRQASAAIVLCMTVMFYPIWFATKTVKNMTKQGIILLIISSLASLIIAVFLLITSIPTYYISVNQQEFWYYIFQFLPIAIALFSWTICHPKRSLLSTHERQENVKRDIGTSL